MFTNCKLSKLIFLVYCSIYIVLIVAFFFRDVGDFRRVTVRGIVEILNRSLLGKRKEKNTKNQCRNKITAQA